MLFLHSEVPHKEFTGKTNKEGGQGSQEISQRAKQCAGKGR